MAKRTVKVKAIPTYYSLNQSYPNLLYDKEGIPLKPIKDSHVRRRVDRTKYKLYSITKPNDALPAPDFPPPVVDFLPLNSNPQYNPQLAYYQQSPFFMPPSYTHQQQPFTYSPPPNYHNPYNNPYIPYYPWESLPSYLVNYAPSTYPVYPPPPSYSPVLSRPQGYTINPTTYY